MTDAVISSALGATTGLMAVGIMSHTAGQMLGKGLKVKKVKHKSSKKIW